MIQDLFLLTCRSLLTAVQATNFDLNRHYQQQQQQQQILKQKRSLQTSQTHQTHQTHLHKQPPRSGFPGTVHTIHSGHSDANRSVTTAATSSAGLPHPGQIFEAQKKPNPHHTHSDFKYNQM